MGAFRPAARVTDAQGRSWEIYATRLELPAWSDRWRGGGGLAAIDALLWLVSIVPRVLWRVFVELPRAALRAHRSEMWTVEAVTWVPHRTTYRWRTTSEYRHHVLAQVEGQLTRGEIPRPRHADFLGVEG